MTWGHTGTCWKYAFLVPTPDLHGKLGVGLGTPCGAEPSWGVGAPAPTDLRKPCTWQVR